MERWVRRMMKTEKKCTVLMCTYNAEKYIVEQLDSLRQQTYPNITVIIYDFILIELGRI